jgi:Zn finger protein HypA/HybF involved in hydrogenase expression
MSRNAFDALERQTTEDQAYREHAAWERSKAPTLCWSCNHAYPEADSVCPACGKINANVDLDGALKQMGKS